MFNRPRCRDWTALATQQLRLRNLIQISGHNIVCEHKTSIYYTLHLTSMSAPFFTSDKLESPKNAIWPEINCQAIVKSTAHSVCIRVWQQSNDVGRQQHQLSSLDKTETAPAVKQIDDKMLFLWGVYFSGLVPISKRTDVKLRENSLVFHIHGGFFTAADCLLPESVPMQLKSVGLLETQRQAIATCAPVTENCDQIVLGRNSIMNLVVAIKDNNTASSNIDIENIDTKQSQNVVYFGQNSAPSKQTLPLQDDPNLLKVRYIEMNFFKSEIRRSYNIVELLLLQEKQRLIRNKTESAKEIMEKICMKSAFCLDLELIANKAMLYRPRGNPSMGRTLNRLLFAQTEQPKPEVLLQAQDIRRKIETARFRCRMLVHERNQAHVNIRKLEQKLGQISDANIEQESWLMANYRGLSKEKEVAIETTDSMRRQQLLLVKAKESLHQRRQQLLRELKEIYCIERDADKHMFRINGAILPSAESFGDAATPSDISVALGYAAHLTLMCSAIMDAPLRLAHYLLYCLILFFLTLFFVYCNRNPIAHKGSQSKIRDNVKAMPDQDRE